MTEDKNKSEKELTKEDIIEARQQAKEKIPELKDINEFVEVKEEFIEDIDSIPRSKRFGHIKLVKIKKDFTIYVIEFVNEEKFYVHEDYVLTIN